MTSMSYGHLFYDLKIYFQESDEDEEETVDVPCESSSPTESEPQQSISAEKVPSNNEVKPRGNKSIYITSSRYKLRSAIQFILSHKHSW